MCICSDRLVVQDCEMHYMNAWLKRCVFNLDLNRESVSEPQTFSGRLFHSLGARYEKVLPPLVDFAILGTTKSPAHNIIYNINKTVFSTAWETEADEAELRSIYTVQWSWNVAWMHLYCKIIIHQIMLWACFYVCFIIIIIIYIYIYILTFTFIRRFYPKRLTVH